MKKWIVLVALVMAGLLVGLAVYRYVFSLESAFAKTVDHWQDANAYGDASTTASLLEPFVNRKGVEFLLAKLEDPNSKAQIAALVNICVISDICLESKPHHSAKDIITEIKGSSFMNRSGKILERVPEQIRNSVNMSLDRLRSD